MTGRFERQDEGYAEVVMDLFWKHYFHNGWLSFTGGVYSWDPVLLSTTCLVTSQGVSCASL